jgi:hypothetical protein
VVTVIPRDDPRECTPRQAIHQLREQRLSGVHGQVLPGKASGKPPPTSNRHHRKSSKNRYRSDTSERFVRITPDSSGLHYYFYFIDPDFGLIHLRVPTWCPFRLQFYCNGHAWLARQLAAEGIGYAMVDNAVIRIDDWERARDLADSLSPERLHRTLDRYAAQCCPVIEAFGQDYHWSLMEVEYATDLVFRSAATLGPLYEQLIRQSVLSVKAEQIASFLGHRITPRLDQEVDTRFSTRIQGTCVKHRFGKASLKMYDKAGIVLRIETTANDVSFFKHHRLVEHRHGPASRALAPVRKTIYSLGCLHERALTARCCIDPLRGSILLGCNRRYLAHLSALDDVSAGVRALGRLTRPRTVDGKTITGINFFAPLDKALLHQQFSFWRFAANLVTETFRL